MKRKVIVLALSIGVLGSSFFLFQNFTTPTVHETTIFSLVQDLRPQYGVTKKLFAINGSGPTELKATGWPHESLEEKDLCEFNYTLGNDSRASIGIAEYPSSLLQAGTPISTVFNRLGWGVHNWHNEYPLCNKTSRKIYSYSNGLELSSGPQVGTNSILINKDYVKLNMRSIDHYRKFLGCPVYRDGKHKDWPELFLNNNFSRWINIKKARKVNLEVASVFTYANYVSSFLGDDCNWRIPDGGTLLYSKDKHASQYRLAFEVVWKDKWLCQKLQTQECWDKLGKKIHIIIPFYDDRARGGYVAGEVLYDAPTKAWIYQIPLRDLFDVAQPGSSPLGTYNPFAVVLPNAIYPNITDAQYAKLNVDLLPFIKQRILQAEASGVGLPPREMLEDGTPESNASYFGHFMITKANLGYEVTGLSHLSLLIKKFDLKYQYVE